MALVFVSFIVLLLFLGFPLLNGDIAHVSAMAIIMWMVIIMGAILLGAIVIAMVMSALTRG